MQIDKRKFEQREPKIITIISNQSKIDFDSMQMIETS